MRFSKPSVRLIVCRPYGLVKRCASASGKHVDDHGPFHCGEVFRGGHALHGHGLLEVSGLEPETVVETIPQEHVLDLHLVVGEIEVQFGEPSFIERGLDGEACATDDDPVVEAELTVVLFEILVGFGLQAVHVRRSRITGGIDIDAVVEP